MATVNTELTFSLPAAADYSASQYLLVLINSSGQAAVVASQGADCVGVLTNDPTAGQAARVAFAGVTKVKAGGTIAAGDKLTTGADGRAETAATDDFVWGWALEGGADGEVISALITHQDVSA